MGLFISFVYLLALLALSGWQLFDVCLGRFTLFHLAGVSLTCLASPVFVLAVSAVLGGGMGGILGGMGELVRHLKGEPDALVCWFVGKVVVLPWFGALLGLLVHALIRAGVAFLGGMLPTGEVDAWRLTGTFVICLLAGYRSFDVAAWLDRQVRRMVEAGAPVRR